jgi:3-hydroxybutyryl-CoA dehydratase
VSLYYEDFEHGAVATSRSRTITETDIVNFAGLSGDFIELHMSEEFARSGPFGRRIAHGALIFSISTGLMTQMSDIANTVVAFYGLDRLRFIKPVFIGDTIHVTKKVIDKQEKGEHGLVTFETNVLNQDQQPVVVYIDKLLLRRRA